MRNRTHYLLIGLGLLFLTALIAAVIVYTQENNSRAITFAECEQLGGVAWQVDVYHPDICSSCVEFRACEIEYNDYSDVCPACNGACQECQDSYSLYESCPECYGPCQSCQNKYLNEFETEEEMHELCPECKKCAECREQLNDRVSNCPPCLLCYECKEENKKYTDIGDVCPQIVPCTECMESNLPYTDKCPDGRKKIGEIIDATTWFQCCR